MSIDAMHWVWNHSQSKGNARLVMLAVADRILTADALVRVGTTELIQRTNSARSSVIKAVDSQVKAGELQVVEAERGTIPTLYCIPGAVGYKRPKRPARGPKTGPVAAPQGSESETPSALQGSENETPQESASSPESGPVDAARGPKTGPHYQQAFTKLDSKQEEPASAQHVGDTIPAAARPLVDGLSLSGVIIRWPFRGNEWFPVLALITKCGVPAMVECARKIAARTNVESAKYFMRAWGDLPPLPLPDAERPPLKILNGSGHQSYRQPSPSTYANDQGF